MNGPEMLVPITIFGGGFAMIFGIFYLRTRENLAMVERGMNPRQQYVRPAPFRSLKLGLLLLGSGIGLLLAYFIDLSLPARFVDGPGYHYRQDNPAIYFALIAAGGGLGLIISYFIEKKWMLDNKELYKNTTT